jgi:ADP-heptose:LPS heptosyltransferase
LEQTYGIRFPTDELADRFAFELREPTRPTFGFHGYFHEPYKPSVVIQRTAAMGDIIALEPVLRWFHEKGCHVYLNTLPQFYELFSDHDYPIKDAREIDGRVPYKFFNLDSAYESFPKELHLKSYFKYCGIENAKMTKPRLYQSGQPLFENYVILHLDNREPYRNIRGVNWQAVIGLLSENGHLVIQLGNSENKIETSAIQVNTISLSMLKYVVSGASLFIGIDSGISNIAVAMDIPSVIFFGSVDPKVIHPDLSQITVVENTNVCTTPKCWGDVVGGETGKECYVDKENPPCTRFTTKQTIKAIKKWIGNK